MPEERNEGMYGKFDHAIDAKGRLFVPSRLREALGDVFYVIVGADHCLTAYPAARWRQIEESFNALRISQKPKLRFLYANLARVEPDKQGRFLLPAKLREYANLTDNVTILGQGDHAEIWNSEAYAAAESEFFDAADLALQFEELGL